MKDTLFFTHDYGARNDPKLQNVMMEHGCEGLGVFWCIVEMLYEQGGQLPLNKCKCIAFALHVQCNIVESIIKDFELFDNDGEKFWSNSVIIRLNKRLELSAKRREAGKLGWQKTFGKSANAEQMQDENMANAEQENSICLAIKGKESKGKESKEKESKEKESKENSIYISSNEDISGNKFPADSKNQKKDEVDYKKVIDLYHSLCPSYTKIIKLSDARRNKIKIRLEEMNGDFDLLRRIYSTMENSKFLRGDNRSGWRATFDWLFENPKNWVKVAEGNYDNKSNATTNNCNDEWK